MLEFFIAALVVAVAPGPDNLFVLAQSATNGAKAGFCVICGLCTGIVVQVCLLVVGVSALIAASPKAFFVLQCLGAAYLLYLAYKSFQVRAGNIVTSSEAVDATSSNVISSSETVDATSSNVISSSETVDATSGNVIARSETVDAASSNVIARSEAVDAASSNVIARSEATKQPLATLSSRKLYFRGVIMNLTNPKAVLFALSFIPPAVRMDSSLSPTAQMMILGGEFIVATFIVFGSVALLAGAVKKFLLNSPKANRNLNWFSGCVFVLLAVALFVL